MKPVISFIAGTFIGIVMALFIFDSVIETLITEQEMRIARLKANRDKKYIQRIPYYRDKNGKPSVQECVIFDDHMNCRLNNGQRISIKEFD